MSHGGTHIRLLNEGSRCFLGLSEVLLVGLSRRKTIDFFFLCLNFCVSRSPRCCGLKLNVTVGQSKQRGGPGILCWSRGVNLI